MRILPISTALAAALVARSAAAEVHDEREPTLLDVQQAREASGTAWQADSTPMFMWHARLGGWQFALHTSSLFGYDSQAGPRGDADVISINWLMGMARHALGSGELMARAMLSAEPYTLPGSGYPLLLQTGESFRDEPLHDRQHPHDLFMELAVIYRQPIADVVGIELYAAPVGEPAIGPPAFPHRFTAMADPLAPLGHHWLDATHITFGVVTAGVFTRWFKLEGSYFNGREPDEERTNFDFRLFDSWSARLSVNPTRDLAAQVSWAHLDSPEWLAVDVSVERITASAIWTRRLAGETSDVGVMAAFGQNDPSMGPTTRAGLLEGTAMFDDTHTVFARAELLTKNGEDLALPEEMADEVFGIGSLSAGYVYDFRQLGAVVPGLGFVGTVGVIGSELGEVYDTRAPLGGMVFVRVRPARMTMESSHHGHTM